MLSVDQWVWSLEYQEACRIIETQTLWGETICRIWLSGRDSVVRIPASRPKSLESAGTASPENIAYVAGTAARDSGRGRWL